MRKIFITALSFLFLANVCFAQINMPKLSLKKQNTKTEKPAVKEPSKPLLKPKQPASPKEVKEYKQLQTPKILQKSQQVKPPKEKKETKINIKNPFKKDKVQTGEDLVSKEQVKEELERVHNLSQQAVALYTDNNLDESIKVFLRIPEKYRTAQDYVLMGNILADLGKREDAIFMYKRAIMTDEYNYKAYYNIGNICLNDEKYFMAIDHYKKAVKYAPDFPYAYYNLGCAYIKAGDLRQAKSKLVKAIELKNTEPDFHYNLAYVYKKLNKPKLANMYLENYNKLTNGQ